MRTQPVGLVLMEEGEQGSDDEGVEDLGGRVGIHDVEDGASINVTVAALVQVEQNVAIPALPKEFLDLWKGDFKGVVQVFNAQMQIGAEEMLMQSTEPDCVRTGRLRRKFASVIAARVRPRHHAPDEGGPHRFRNCGPECEEPAWQTGTAVPA